MTAEERIRYEALLEDLKRDVRVIADGHIANAENLMLAKAELEQRAERIEHQVMVLDVKLNQKIDGLDARLNQKIDGLDARLNQKIDGLDARLNQKIDALDARLSRKIDALDAKFDVLAADLARIATHLGLGGAPPPAPPR